MSDVALRVDHVVKTFRMPHEKMTSLKQNAVHLFSKRSYNVFTATDDVSFEVKKGEFFGIVGRNGSGKSTLLKMLAGIYFPTSGNVTVNGTLSPFIELGVGFNPELSARDNVFLNGAILGLSRKEIEKKFDEIIAFAELEDFIDQKLKNFSSGMQVRLAFSISILAQSDILLVDEVLAVGDLNFQEKCFDVFRQLKASGRTIVFVTHDMNTVVEFCDRAAFIDAGVLKFIGAPDKAANLYYQQNAEKVGDRLAEANSQLRSDYITDITLLGADDKPKTLFKTGDTLTLGLNIKNQPDAKNLGIAVFREDGLYCYGTNTIIEKIAFKTGGITVEFPNLQLLTGSYYFKIGIFGDKDTDVKLFLDRVASFKVTSDDARHGVAELSHKWSL